MSVRSFSACFKFSITSSTRQPRASVCCHRSRRESTTVPARNRLTVPVTLEQFLSPDHLRIVAVANLKPSWALRIIRRAAVPVGDLFHQRRADQMQQSKARRFLENSRALMPLLRNNLIKAQPWPLLASPESLPSIPTIPDRVVTPSFLIRKFK